MECKKCRAPLRRRAKFCGICGSPVIKEDPPKEDKRLKKMMEEQDEIIDFDIQDNDDSVLNDDITIDNSKEDNDEWNEKLSFDIQNNDIPKKKKKIPVKLLAIIGMIIIGIIILIVILVSKMSPNSNKLICEAKEGNITIMYDENGIIGYKSRGILYNLEAQQKYAKEIGIDSYLKVFSKWYEEHTSGECIIFNKEESSSKQSKNDTSNKKVVGNDTYGYITIPNEWIKIDTTGQNTLQYSYSNAYKVTLEVLIRGTSAQEYATRYKQKIEDAGEVKDIMLTTITIGKDNEYQAYQISMFNPNNNTKVITYWFDAKDGRAHYIALEGPSDKVKEYIYIPESFSLKK